MMEVKNTVVHHRRWEVQTNSQEDQVSVRMMQEVAAGVVGRQPLRSGGS